jgi:hypothetical protein
MTAASLRLLHAENAWRARVAGCWRWLPVLLLALACGKAEVGKAEVGEAEDPAGPIDAVVWLAPNQGPVEVAGIRAGRSGLESVGTTNGAYALSPDRTRVFLEQDRGAVVASFDGLWLPDGNHLAFFRSDSIGSLAWNGSQLTSIAKLKLYSLRGWLLPEAPP